MHIAIVGSGYVGLVGAACLAELGHEVSCMDRDREKVARLARGEVPIYEQYLDLLLERHRGERLQFTDDLPAAVAEADVVFIAVGTPAEKNGGADLSSIEAVVCELARSLTGYKLIVEKSTVPVCTGEWIRSLLLLNGAPAGSFDVASNPEFLREGTAVADFLYPDRIVMGADSERAAALLREVYAPLAEHRYNLRADAIPQPDKTSTPARVISTSVKSAELIKQASNAFLATKISFANAIANVCESVGADVREVVEGIGSDSRIGGRFLQPGIGYGGSCLPKDLCAFQALASECGVEFGLLHEVSEINRSQRARFIAKVRDALWTLRGKRLAVWGLAFKGGTDDVRESPAIAICQALLKEGAQIVAYDPAAINNSQPLLPGADFAASATGATVGADALLILTDWKEFTDLDMAAVARLMRSAILVDGRNLLDPTELAAAGFYYSSIGRPDAQPKWASAKMARLTQAA